MQTFHQEDSLIKFIVIELYLNKNGLGKCSNYSVTPEGAYYSSSPPELILPRYTPRRIAILAFRWQHCFLITSDATFATLSKLQWLSQNKMYLSL